jgi:hypothetical protein
MFALLGRRLHHAYTILFREASRRTRPPLVKDAGSCMSRQPTRRRGAPMGWQASPAYAHGTRIPAGGRQPWQYARGHVAWHRSSQHRCVSALRAQRSRRAVRPSMGPVQRTSGCLPRPGAHASPEPCRRPSTKRVNAKEPRNTAVVVQTHRRNRLVLNRDGDCLTKGLFCETQVESTDTMCARRSCDLTPPSGFPPLPSASARSGCPASETSP